MGASGRTYLHPEPHREHAPVTRRAAAAAGWLLIGIVVVAWVAVLWMLLAGMAGVGR